MIEAVKTGGFTLDQRKALAAEAFRHTASYDVAVASWMGAVVAPDADGGKFPGWVAGVWERAATLRYGENPHQPAALYIATDTAPGIAQADQLHGKGNVVQQLCRRRCRVPRRVRLHRPGGRNHQTCEPVWTRDWQHDCRRSSKRRMKLIQCLRSVG